MFSSGKHLTRSVNIKPSNEGFPGSGFFYFSPCPYLERASGAEPFLGFGAGEDLGHAGRGVGARGCLDAQDRVSVADGYDVNAGEEVLANFGVGIKTFDNLSSPAIFPKAF